MIVSNTVISNEQLALFSALCTLYSIVVIPTGNNALGLNPCSKVMLAPMQLSIKIGRL